MCNRFISRVLQKCSIVFCGISVSGSVECYLVDKQEGGEKDRDTFCSVFAGNTYGYDVWCVKGSYTVEAALVFPIVLAVILFLIYSAFYMHNRAVLMEAAYETAIYGTTLDVSDIDTAKRKVLGKCYRSLSDRLISAGKPSYDIQANKNRITVSVKSTMNTVQLEGIGSYQNSTLSVTRSANYVNPIDRVRLYKYLHGMQ